MFDLNVDERYWSCTQELYGKLILVLNVLYRDWTAQKAENPNILPFHEWVKENVNQQSAHPTSPEEMDQRLLCRKPLQQATRYLRMRAFGNHF
jgi:hypothetical protein